MKRALSVKNVTKSNIPKSEPACGRSFFLMSCFTQYYKFDLGGGTLQLLWPL